MTVVFAALIILILIFGVVVFRGAPYVPSVKKYAARAFDELHPLTDQDVVVDVGSGDGVILRLAAEKGAWAVGYELNPILVAISKLLSKGSPRIQTHLADFWLVTLPAETTVVYAFSVGRDMKKLADKMQQTADSAGHAIHLITYGHTIDTIEPKKKTSSHHLYVFTPKA